MKEYKGKYSAVIEAGMQVLDAKVPGWECKIDPDVLELNSCQLCVLGQVYGDYLDGKRQLGIEDGTPYGFSLNSSKTNEYRFLTRAWLRLLRTRVQSKLTRYTRRIK